MRYLLLIAATVLCTFHTAVWAADPVLTVTEARRGEWTFGGLADPAVELDGETGCDVIPWAFSWHAVPGDPGRTITHYRYGFDIVDLDDPLAWEIDWTPEITRAPPRSFFFGTHTFHVEARDDAGAITRGSFIISITNAGFLPSLTVTEATRGSWIFVGLDSPVITLTDPLTSPVTPWAFEWVAMACGPGNLIDGDRYGWDIIDLADDAQWTPWGDFYYAPPRVFTAGVHTFMVEARNNAGAVVRGTIVFEVLDSSVPIKMTTWGQIKYMISQ